MSPSGHLQFLQFHFFIFMSDHLDIGLLTNEMIIIACFLEIIFEFVCSFLVISYLFKPGLH